MNDSRGRATVSGIIRIVLIVIGVSVFLALTFFVIDMQVRGKAAFRDAKNVYLALNSVEIEYYAAGKTIYDPTNVKGLAEGVEEKVERLADSEGNYRIISYDSRNHKIKELQYNNGKYYVFYTQEKGKAKWEVKYMMTINRYED